MEVRNWLLHILLCSQTPDSRGASHAVDLLYLSANIVENLLTIISSGPSNRPTCLLGLRRMYRQHRGKLSLKLVATYNQACSLVAQGLVNH
jgi:hypothetical protein